MRLFRRSASAQPASASHKRAAGASKALLAAAIGAVGFFAMGAAPAAASSVKCVASAETKLGKELRDTREAATRNRARRACGVALDKCERSLDRLRHRTGRPFRFATCRVQDRIRVAEAHRVRCAAQAFTRRGFEVSNTRAAEVRRNRRAACRVAIDRCERKLERKRDVTGKRFPHARCEVTGTRRVAFDWDTRGHAPKTPVGLLR
ncbi:MAG: hypothetical protein AAGM38_00595 [Pseudomonadota bacterium]